MGAQNSNWRSMLTSCFMSQNENNKKTHPSPTKTRKDHSTTQSSIQRLSLSDLSNPSSFMSEDLSISLAGSNLHVFTLQELKVVTQSFSSSNFLGEGGFGPVHKGFIDDKLRPGLKAQPVAVKLLDLDGTQGHKEWLTEVIFLGQLRHAHLVKLIGYCCEDEHRLLVYEYMPRGSLENQLFRRYSVSLPWSARMKIAYGAAKGLEYLHELEKPVIFRDFKASNILLDSDFTSKLSDFGLAKDGPEGSETHVSTRVMGTHGYAAPEYIMTGHLTSMSDVYSFGVVLLELITGRRSVDKNRPQREQNLVEWARPMLNDPRKLNRIIDPRLEGQYSEMGARKAASLAYQCLSYRPKHRPTMSEVVKALETLKDYVDIPMGPFVYTVPTQHSGNSNSTTSHDSSTKEEKNCEGTQSGKNHERRQHHHKHKLHQGGRDRHQQQMQQRRSSPRSPTVHSETNLRRNYYNSNNSPMHYRERGA